MKKSRNEISEIGGASTFRRGNYQSNQSIHTQQSVESILFPMIDLKMVRQESSSKIISKANQKDSIIKNFLLNFSTISSKVIKDDITLETNKSRIKKYTNDAQFDESSHVYMEFDKAATQISLLEEAQPLFKPIAQKQLRYTPVQNMDPDDVDIEGLIESDNVELKKQYIDMVYQGQEQSHLMYLLSECGINAEERFENFKFRVRQAQQMKKLGRVQKQDNLKLLKEYKEIDSKQIKDMKVRIKRMIDRGEKMITPQHNIDIYRSHSMKFLTKVEKAEIFKQQSKQKKIQIEYIQERKQKMFEERQRFIKLRVEEQAKKQLERSLEYRSLQKEKQKKNLIILSQIRHVMVAMNVERILAMMRALAEEGYKQKRLLFKEHMKARIIQTSMRKLVIINKMKKFFSPRQIYLARNLIFAFRINRRVQQKQKAARRLNLWSQRQTIKKHFRSKLTMMMHSVRNIQAFCKWYNLIISTQLSSLNQKWDAYVLGYPQQFIINSQFATDIKDSEFQHRFPDSNQFDDLNEKIRVRKQKMMTRIPQNVKITSLLHIRPQLMLHTYELKFAILRKIEMQKQQDEEKEKFERFFNDVLLMYTKHSNFIEIKPIALRVKTDPQILNQLYERLVFEDLKIKTDVLRSYLRDQRKQFALSMRDYYNQLLRFKQLNNEDINTERIKLMLKTKVEDLKLLAKQEKEEMMLIASRKKKSNIVYSQQVVVQKPNIFAQFREFQNDHLPFGSLTLKITELMYGNKPKFRVKLSLDTWKRLMTTYHNNFKARYDYVVNQSRSIQQSQVKSKQKGSQLV